MLGAPINSGDITPEILPLPKRGYKCTVHISRVLKLFVYTVTYRPTTFPGEYLNAQDAKKKAIGQGNPDIGPLSFFDMVHLDQSEKGLERRCRPMRMGKKGRPCLTKHLVRAN